MDRSKWFFHSLFFILRWRRRNANRSCYARFLPRKLPKTVLLRTAAHDFLPNLRVTHKIFFPVRAGPPQQRCATLRWEPVTRTVGITGSQKVNFLQKRSAKIYVFALLSPSPILGAFPARFRFFLCQTGAHLKVRGSAQNVLCDKPKKIPCTGLLETFWIRPFVRFTNRSWNAPPTLSWRLVYTKGHMWSKKKIYGPNELGPMLFRVNRAPR